MRALLREERGIVGAYIRVLIVVAAVAIGWLVLNEVVVKVGAIAQDMSSDPSASNVIVLVLKLWRIFPIVLFVGAMIWAVLMSSREEPYYFPG